MVTPALREAGGCRGDDLLRDGINWTTVRCDDPFHRGFEYVPFSGEDLYGPIDELWI
jgi:hypothetical protein